MKKKLKKILINILIIIYVLISPNNNILASETGEKSIDYHFIRSWGGEADQIINPPDVTWGKNGKIYIANDGLDRVTLIDSQINTYKIWGHTGFDYPMEFQRPNSIDVDFEGNIYISDLNWNITKISPDGELIDVWNFQGVQNISFDSQGFLYLITNYNSINPQPYINKFTSEGELIKSWGEHGCGVAQFQYAQGLVVDKQGNIYVADTGCNRIQKFDTNGNFLMMWGESGSEPGQFSGPWGIVLDNNGNLYVSDRRNHRIQVFTSDGKFLRQWGGLGINPGEFNFPKGLSINENGLLLVSDTNNNRIQIFQNDGTYLRQFGKINSYSSSNYFRGPIAIDNEQNIYIADNQLYMIQKFNKNMELLKKWDSQYYGRIWGISYDPEGFIYYTNGCKVIKNDLYGSCVNEWGDCSTGSPMQIDVDSNSNVFVNWGHIETRKYDKNGNLITSWTHPTNKWIAMNGLTIDGGNNVYISDPNFSSIYKFSNDGNWLDTLGMLNGPGGLNAHLNLIFATDQFGNKSYVYDVDGNLISEIGSKGTGPGEFIWPYQISTYKAQNIFIGDGGGLQKFSTIIQTNFLNGSFEDAFPLDEWSFGGIISPEISSNAKEGRQSLLLGKPVDQTEQGENYSWAHQTIFIDPNIERPILKFSYNMFVNDILDYSDFFVQIQDGTGRNYLSTVVRDGYQPCIPGTAPAAGTNLGWRSVNYDLSAYKGQHIRLVFSNRNLWPISWGIWTYVDDVKVLDAGPLPPPAGSERLTYPQYLK